MSEKRQVFADFPLDRLIQITKTEPEIQIMLLAPTPLSSD